MKAKSSWGFGQNSTYIIAGGPGGQGRSVARWLTAKSARHLLLLSRSGMRSKTAAKSVEEMTTAGVNIHAPVCDITDAISLRKVLEYCETKMPPIRGCVQSAMVIRVSHVMPAGATRSSTCFDRLTWNQDIMFERMSYRKWKEALLPKVTGSAPPPSRDLDFFVFFSSVAGTIGSQPQSTYVAGNAFEDSLAQFRTSRGERATSIDLGAMESAGILAGASSSNRSPPSRGFCPCLSRSCSRFSTYAAITRNRRWFVRRLSRGSSSR